MRITRAGEYGVRCILYLSSKGVGMGQSQKSTQSNSAGSYFCGAFKRG